MDYVFTEVELAATRSGNRAKLVAGNATGGIHSASQDARYVLDNENIGIGASMRSHAHSAWLVLPEDGRSRERQLKAI